MEDSCFLRVGDEVVLLIPPPVLRAKLLQSVDEMESSGDPMPVADVCFRLASCTSPGAEVCLLDFSLERVLADASSSLSLFKDADREIADCAHLCLSLLGYYCLLAMVDGLESCDFLVLSPERIFLFWLALVDCCGRPRREHGTVYGQFRVLVNSLAEVPLGKGTWMEEVAVQSSAYRRVDEFVFAMDDDRVAMDG